jgi:1-deoxy-D-xylulose-5-phosphate synthase
LAFMRCIPNLIIAAPSNEIELRNMMQTALEYRKGPFVIRYPRGKGSIIDWKNEMKSLEIGKGQRIKEGKDIAILTIGTMLNPASEAIDNVEKETGVSLALYDLRFLKPLDKEILNEVAEKFTKIITIEDGVINGGFGSAIIEYMCDNQHKVNVKRLGISDTFVEHGSPEELYNMLGLNAEGIAASIKKFID